MNQRFSPADFDRIREAVKKAESKISGEIVPVFVEQSDDYDIAYYRGALLGSFILFLLIIVVDRYFTWWAITDPLTMLLYVVSGGLLMALLVRFFPFLRRLLIGQSYMDKTTRRRAENAFLTEEVFRTRQRTGIMIFVSFFEREVIVMADSGISKKVEQTVWDELVSTLIQHFKKKQVVDGLERAIARCSEILLEKGFPIDPDDINELNDDLRNPN